MLLTKRKGIQSDRYIKKQRKKLLWVFLLALVALGSLLVASVFLFKASFLQIQKINIISALPLVTPATDIHNLVEQDLTGTRGYFFSKNNLILYSRQNIRSDLLQHFPRIQSVNFNYSNLTTLNVVVVERVPFALACIETDTVTNSCFYMDAMGFVYAPAPQFSAGVFVKYYSTSSTSSVVLNSTLIDTARLDIARQSTNYFSQMGLLVTKVFFDNNDNYRVVINDTATTTATTSTIYFNNSTPQQTTLEYFSRFWQNRTDHDFDYIDLRYGNDIVFKMHAAE